MTKEVFILTESESSILEESEIEIEVSDRNDEPRKVIIDAGPMMDYLVREFLN